VITDWSGSCYLDGRLSLVCQDMESFVMKNLLSVCAFAGALGLFAAPASAQQFVANLSGGEETPAPGILTGASGVATVNIDGAEIAVSLTVFNLPSATTAAHIHVGAKGIAGPVVINFPITTGVTGDLSQTFRLGPSSFVARAAQGILTFTDAIQAIVTGNAYVNIHTLANGGGEIRGQLTVRP
jgi:hypothetical protein